MVHVYFEQEKIVLGVGVGVKLQFKVSDRNLSLLHESSGRSPINTVVLVYFPVSEHWSLQRLDSERESARILKNSFWPTL